MAVRDLYSGFFEGILGTAPVNLLSCPSGKVTQWCVSIDTGGENWAAADTNSIPRMRVSWGRGKAQRSLVADLQSCRFTVECDNIDVAIYRELDDTAGTVTPAYLQASAVIVPGRTNSALFNTTRATPFNTPAGYRAVPDWAQAVEVLLGSDAPPFGEAVPVSTYLLIHHGNLNSAGGAVMQTHDMSKLIYSPKPVYGAGIKRTWNHSCGDANDTTSFRLRWHLGM